MRAVTPQGGVKWAFKINSEIKSSPAIADDGTIYFGARDRKFYAVTPQGKLKWTFTAGAWIDSSPAIAGDGTIYFGSWDANFYALNPDGSKKWVFATSNIVVSSPAIGKDGTIYFGSHDKKFYALKPDGKLLWSFTTGGPIISSPAINPDGIIYFTSTDGNLYALKPDGTERWRLHTGGVTESSPVLDESGNIYLIGERQRIRSVDREREKAVGLVFAGSRWMPLPPWPQTAWFIFPRHGGPCLPFKATAPICGTPPRTGFSSLRRSLATTEPFISATAYFCGPSIPPTGCRRRQKVHGRCSAPTPVTPAGCKA